MDRASFSTAAALGLCVLALAACDGAGPTAAPVQPHREGLEAGYVAPPHVTSLEPSGAQVLLVGEGAPGAVVRLATPQGDAVEAKVDATGHWRLGAPARPQAAIFGLSQVVSGRTVQSQGYMLITPDGRGVLLRAGAGAVLLGDRPETGLTTFDIDRDGGAVVSGRGPAGGSVSARVDGRKLGEGRIDPDGRFALALSGPVAPGLHSVKVFGDSVDAGLAFEVSPAAPLTDGPFRATAVPAGLRVDWMTPGGGVQTTFVAGPASGEPSNRVIP